MDGRRFDAWARRLAAGTCSRRRTIRVLAGGALATIVAMRDGDAVAGDRFKCTEIEKPCERGDECCSGLCRGPKDRKTCRPHDTGTCRAGQNACNEDEDNIPTCGAQDNCFCVTTTGNAPFCASGGDCARCQEDRDCVKRGFGKGAACIKNCRECKKTGKTACVSACGDEGPAS